MTIQTVVYYFLSCAAVYVENKVTEHRSRLETLRSRVDEHFGIPSGEEARQIIAGK